MAKGFSDITPESVGGNTGGNGAPVAATQSTTGGGPRPSGASAKRRRWVWIAAAAIAVAVIVLVIGLVTGGSDSDEAGDAPQTPHGPSRIVDGIPSGYTHDQGGAATAAVNFVQAQGRAYEGRLKIESVQKAMVAQDPTPGLVKVLDNAKDRTDVGSTSNDLPATTTVRSFSPNEADVSIWTVTAGSGVIDAQGGKATSATWGTTNLHLVWESEDWKVQDHSFKTGPQPGQQTDTAGTPIESGYYSFFVN